MRLIVLALLAPSLLLIPLAARAQPPGKVYHIGHVTIMLLADRGIE
jgi:hypothetical protein